MSLELDKDEFIVHQAKRNWVVVFAETIGIIFTVLIPLFAFSIFDSFESVVFAGNQTAFFMIIIFSWIFIVWNIVFLIWTDHFLDILIITNKNLIDIEQKGIWRREISVMDLGKIQDVTTEITGFIGTILNYGDIHIQTAGFEREFKISKINNPNIVRAKIKEACNHEFNKSAE